MSDNETWVLSRRLRRFLWLKAFFIVNVGALGGLFLMSDDDPHAIGATLWVVFLQLALYQRILVGKIASYTGIGADAARPVIRMATGVVLFWLLATCGGILIPFLTKSGWDELMPVETFSVVLAMALVFVPGFFISAVLFEQRLLGLLQEVSRRTIEIEEAAMDWRDPPVPWSSRRHTWVPVWVSIPCITAAIAWPILRTPRSTGAFLVIVVCAVAASVVVVLLKGVANTIAMARLSDRVETAALMRQEEIADSEKEA